MTKALYEERDRAASNSYTLHMLKNKVVHQGEMIEEAELLRAMFLGNITFRRAKSGMRTTCYLHIFGSTIVKGIANGCGYDVQSAAFAEAVKKYGHTITLGAPTEPKITRPHSESVYKLFDAAVQSCENDGRRWKDALETKAGIFAAHIGG